MPQWCSKVFPTPPADLATVLGKLQIEDAFEALHRNWRLSQRSFCKDSLFFLEPDSVRGVCQAIRMSDQVSEVLLRSLSFFEEHPEARRLAWHFHVLLFRRSDRKPPIAGGWPMLPESLGEGALLFYVYILLSGFHYIKDFHYRRGIPEEVTLDTLADLELWIREYRRLHGRWGLREYGWLYRHFLGRLYKLGRLQFEMARFHLDYHAFRNRSNQRVVVLAGQGMRFRRDGQFNGANGIEDSEGTWTGEFSNEDGVVRGCPISPKGFALRESATLLLDEWEEILKIHDPTLAVHIDAGGPMDHTACGDSMRGALEFFPQHFPEHRFRAFTCDSWLMDNQLADHLPEESNIVRFLREFYLLPLEGASDRQTMERVFDGPLRDLDSAPQRTSLQRAIIRHMKAGGCWRESAGVIFPERSNWGKPKPGREFF